MEQKVFIEQLRTRLGKEKKEVERQIVALLQIVKEKSSQMDTISIQGFGVFEPRKKMERISVNPSTGKRMLIPPKVVLTFKPGTTIKSKLKELDGHE